MREAGGAAAQPGQRAEEKGARGEEVKAETRDGCTAGETK